VLQARLQYGHQVGKLRGDELKNFIKITDGVTVMPLLLAIHAEAKRSDVWREDTYLRGYPQGPFGDVESIILRFPPVSVFETEAERDEYMKTVDQHECADLPVYNRLPQFRPVIMALMSAVGGERLGRCIINKLKPGGRIFPHCDGAEHAAYYDRFHIVLKSHPGNNFRCEDESVSMRDGEVWWFNNSVEHEVINNSADDRIHLIVDIKTGGAR